LEPLRSAHLHPRNMRRSNMEHSLATVILLRNTFSDV